VGRELLSKKITILLAKKAEIYREEGRQRASDTELSAPGKKRANERELKIKREGEKKSVSDEGRQAGKKGMWDWEDRPRRVQD